MEETAPRRLPLTGAQLEQDRIHEAHLAADLAMWDALVWQPEARAEQLKSLGLALRAVRVTIAAAVRALLSARRVGSQLGPPTLPRHHLITAPRTGPPADAVAAGIALPDRTGGVLISP